jgi:hypothetical protein
MQQVATDRVWLSPTMTEMRKAVKSLRATAPASVWQAMCGSEDLEKAMLDVMIRCWVDKEVPADWRKFYMITLKKKSQSFTAFQLPGHINLGNFLEGVRFHIKS